MIDGGGFVDIHSHLVPGVDDGARTMEDALESIDRMVTAGVGTILTTPHFDASLLSTPAAAEERIEAVEASFGALRDAVAVRFPDLVLRRGFEIMLDTPDPDLSDPRVRLDATDFVLVEWPSMQVPPGTPGVLERIRSRGRIPVIAHPERYHFGGSMVELGQQWKTAGAFLQVNQGSLTGRYGGRVEKRAWQLLEGGLADYLASDHHSRPHLELHLGAIVEEFDAMDAGEALQMMIRVNPQRLLEGETPFPVQPVSAPAGWKRRLRSMFTTEAG